MNNWKYDGWTSNDWENLENHAGDLHSIASQYDAAIGGGGGGFTPEELSEIIDRMTAATERLKRIRSNYL